MEVNLRPGKPVLGVTSSSATSKVLTQTIGTCGGAVYDAAVALVDVLDKLTYPLTGSWDDKPACRPDQVSIINGYVCMYVVKERRFTSTLFEVGRAKFSKNY